jgi:hypothetical protein
VILERERERERERESERERERKSESERERERERERGRGAVGSHVWGGGDGLCCGVVIYLQVATCGRRPSSLR